jgi:hypothetical protein
MAMQKNWPQHAFDPGPMALDPNDLDPVCYAVLETGVDEIHGYSHQTQCGYRRSEH